MRRYSDPLGIVFFLSEVTFYLVQVSHLHEDKMTFQLSEHLKSYFQGPMCFCIDQVPSSAVPVAGSFCQTSCPGEQVASSGTYVSQCGNTDTRYNTVSVYRRCECRVYFPLFTKFVSKAKFPRRFDF